MKRHIVFVFIFAFILNSFSYASSIEKELVGHKTQEEIAFSLDNILIKEKRLEEKIKALKDLQEEVDKTLLIMPEEKKQISNKIEQYVKNAEHNLRVIQKVQGLDYEYYDLIKEKSYHKVHLIYYIAYVVAFAVFIPLLASFYKDKLALYYCLSILVLVLGYVFGPMKLKKVDLKAYKDKSYVDELISTIDRRIYQEDVYKILTKRT